jgi:ribosome-associated toxin RatA of RatAB toxin-antitoxin module
MSLVKVESHCQVIGKWGHKVWEIISNIENYPVFMNNVNEVKIIERVENEGISEWYAQIEDAPLHWVEHDFFYPEKKETQFISKEGDFEIIRGGWKINENDDNTTSFKMTIEYNLGIPVIEEVFGHILKEKIILNIQMMMDSIKRELMIPA